MAAIIATSAGAGVKPETQETITAVATATASMSQEDGATATKIGEILKLDKASALRRLRNAANAGLVVNLEQRRGQPGRYRLTGEEIKPVEVLPDPDAVFGTLTPSKSAHPRNRKLNGDMGQEDSDLAGCTVACAQVPAQQWPKTPHATAQPVPPAKSLILKEELQSVARLQEFRSPPDDGDRFANLKSSAWKPQL